MSVKLDPNGDEKLLPDMDTADGANSKCDSVVFYLNLICVSTYVFIFSYFAFNKTIKSVFRVQSCYTVSIT